MPTRNISNLANIASGFLSITEIPFWLNTSNENQIVVMLAGKLQTCCVKTIYKTKDKDDAIVKIFNENILNKHDYIIVVSLEKLSVWLIPEHAITGTKILRLGKIYEQYKYSIVDTALTRSKVKTSDIKLKEDALAVVKLTKGSKFNQISLENFLHQDEETEEDSLIVDRS